MPPLVTLKNRKEMRKNVIQFLANAAAKGFDLSNYIDNDKLDLSGAEIDAEDFLIKNTPLEEKAMWECELYRPYNAADNQYYHYSDDDVDEEVSGDIFDFSARYKAEDNTLYEMRMDEAGNFLFKPINDFEFKEDLPEGVYGYVFVFAEVVKTDCKVLRLFDFL